MDNNKTAQSPVLLKITIEGAAGTGKTSLALAIHDLLTSLHGNVQVNDPDLDGRRQDPLQRLMVCIDSGIEFEINTVMAPKRV